MESQKMRTLTKKMQDKITPEEAIDLLKKGNERFVNNLKINRNLLQQINETSEGQHPFAVILSCIDSRTSAELIFDQGLGDIFSIRIAGNIINDDILGSMEFGCKVAGAKLIVVLGHTECGAVKGACDKVEMGNLSGLLHKIIRAVDDEKTVLEDRSSNNKEFLDKVTLININNNIDEIKKNSSILDEMVKSGEINIVGAIHNISTGEVDFFNKK